jgi:hypothetical protein
MNIVMPVLASAGVLWYIPRRGGDAQDESPSFDQQQSAEKHDVRRRG